MALRHPTFSRKLTSLAVLTALAVGAACSSDNPATTAPDPIDVQLSQSVVTLIRGETNTAQVNATVVGTSNTGVNWTSANESIATVSQSGLITAVSDGETFVTAVSQQDPSRNRSVVVKVVSTVVTVTPTTASTTQGNTPIQLQATVENNPNTAVTWSSADPLIATVSQTGLVTPVAGGTTTILATSVADPSKVGSATVTFPPHLTSGVARTGLAAPTNAETVYFVHVPAGSSSLKVTLTGGTGDADIYIWHNAIAGDTICESWNDGNAEECIISNPPAGGYYILVHAWSGYTGVTLTATITP